MQRAMAGGQNLRREKRNHADDCRRQHIGHHAAPCDLFHQGNATHDENGDAR